MTTSQNSCGLQITLQDQFGKYDQYAAQLYRYAYRRVGPDHAEDVVAESFLAAFRQRDTYDPLGRTPVRGCSAS